MRSETRPISTPSTSRITATMASACSGSWVSIVMSMRTLVAPDAVTSRPVTTPPAFSMTPVISLTAVARAGRVRRTVTELAMEGLDGIPVIEPPTDR